MGSAWKDPQENLLLPRRVTNPDLRRRRSEIAQLCILRGLFVLPEYGAFIRKGLQYLIIIHPRVEPHSSWIGGLRCFERALSNQHSGRVAADHHRLGFRLSGDKRQGRKRTFFRSRCFREFLFVYSLSKLYQQYVTTRVSGDSGLDIMRCCQQNTQKQSAAKILKGWERRY